MFWSNLKSAACLKTAGRKHNFSRSLFSKCLLLAFFALLPLFTTSADAATLTVDGESTNAKSCPNMPVVLKLTDHGLPNGTAINWYSECDGTTKVLGTTTTQTGIEDIMVEEVGEKETKFIAKQQNGTELASISVAISNDCKSTCHTTTTGEYYSGTDFNLIDSSLHYKDNASIPNDIVSHFNDNDIKFTGKNGTITNSVRDGYTTSPDAAVNTKVNSYYETTELRPFDLSFPYGIYKGKNYRYNMRFYITIEKNSSCQNFDNNAKLYARTEHGTTSDDYLYLEIYDDEKNNSPIFSKGDNSSTAFIEINKNGELNKYINNNFGKREFITLRFECSFYGYFPTDNSPQFFTFYPLFEQFGLSDCRKIYIDYISAIGESVCLDKNPVCKDGFAIANAAGFAKDAIYLWEEKVGDNWKQLSAKTNEIEFKNGGEQLYIKVDWLGKKRFRVKDGNKTNSTGYEFDVIGRPCEGAPIKNIEGNDIVCVPNTIEYAVNPIDEYEGTKYYWYIKQGDNKLTPDENSFTSDETERGKAKITFTKKMKEGKYTLGVYSSKDGYNSTPFEKEITLREQPSVSLELQGDYFGSVTSEDEKELCPADKNQVIKAIVDSPNNYKPEDYTYTWTKNATGTAANNNSAIVDITTLANRCTAAAGTLTFPIEVTVSKDGCQTTVSNTYNVRESVNPEIKCDEFIVSSPTNYVLEGKQKDTLITLPVPKFSADCDPNPTLTITLAGKRTNETITLSKKEVDEIIATSTKDSKLEIRLKSDSIKVNYTVEDGCEKKASCSIDLYIRDITAPDVSCDSIPAYTTRLSNYSNCVAVPGQHADLPTLTEPELWDMNGVDGLLKGVYLGRLLSATVPNKDAALFNKKIDLNADYEYGDNYILWGFYDFDYNVSYCLQKVTVIDDKKPNVSNCPTDAFMGDIAMNNNECGLSLDTLLAHMDQSRIPFAKDNCSSTEIIEPRYFYREKGETEWKEITDKSALLFEKDKTYDIAWRFYKTLAASNPAVDADIYGECIQTFTTKDKQGPIFDCANLAALNVSVNQDSKKVETFKYASAKDPSGTDKSNITYTLKDAFKEIPVPADNCGGVVTVFVEIEKPDNSKETIGNETNLEELQKYMFPIGVSEVVYTFTDEDGNKTICRQSVTVSSKYAPIADCRNTEKFNDSTFVSKGTCKVSLEITTNDVPTATYPYFYEVRDNHDNYNGYKPENYEKYHIRNSLSKEVMPGPDGFPFKVVRTTKVDSITLLPTDKSDVYTLDNPLEEGDTIITKVVRDVKWDNGELKVLSIHNHEVVNVKRSNFKELTEELTKDFPTGTNLLTWYFSNGMGDTSKCVAKIVVKDTTAPVFDCATLKPVVSLIADEGVCENSVEINIPEAKDFCNPDYIVKGIGVRSDGKAMDEKFPAGKTVIKWAFTSPYSITTKICEQDVIVKSNTPPVIDCDTMKDIVVYTELDECEVSADKVNLGNPHALDFCTADTVWGVPVRAMAKSLTEPYPTGTTVITWIFESEYSQKPAECKQNVVVKDTTVPSSWSCDLIQPRVVEVPITTSNNFVTAQDAVNEGLALDGHANLFVDNCGDVKIAGIRSDGKELTDNYPLGYTEITWLYTDYAGNDMTCNQTVHVKEMDNEDMKCPEDLDGKVFECYASDEIKPYATFEEFKISGGYWKYEKYLKPNTFTHADEIFGDTCNMEVVRTYSVKNLRDEISTCKQTFKVYDDKKPEFTSLPKDLFITCETDEIPEPEELTAIDNCKGEFKVKATVENLRVTDPNLCEYYNYKIIHTWVASDACGNTNRHSRTVHILDTVPPVVKWPDFMTDTVLATRIGSCRNLAPNYEELLKGLVEDNCNEPQNIRITQVPAAGTLLEENTDVKVTVSDLCGNVVERTFHVRVSKRSMVVNIDAKDTSVCITDRLDITSNTFKSATGMIDLYDYDFNEIVSIYSSIFVDYYKDSIDKKNLIFSNNPKTYGDIFKKMSNEEVLDRTRIISRKQSGTYVFVAMDTIAGCTDTATAYLDFMERPRVSLDGSAFDICEGDSITISGSESMFYRANVCIDDMGSEITRSGWILDGKQYNEGDVVTSESKVLAYFAENACGSSNSINSLFTHCSLMKSTTSDSLEVVGEDDLELWRKDQLYSNDSILLNVHKKYSSKNLMLTTNPSDKARVWRGDKASLTAKTVYEPAVYMWYKVNNRPDGSLCDEPFGKDGSLKEMCDDGDEPDELIATTYAGDNDAFQHVISELSDTARYYVLVSDMVCPAVQSNIVQIDVMDRLPSAITPHTLDGLNDAFMRGYSLTIFNRYGQTVFSGKDGWDGKMNGELADPGVYFYEVTMKDGRIENGSVEVVKIR